jgi:hypothetical protein
VQRCEFINLGAVSLGGLGQLLFIVLLEQQHALVAVDLCATCEDTKRRVSKQSSAHATRGESEQHCELSRERATVLSCLRAVALATRVSWKLFELFDLLTQAVHSSLQDVGAGLRRPGLADDRRSVSSIASSSATLAFGGFVFAASALSCSRNGAGHL